MTFFFLGDHLKLDRKTDPILVKTFFFERGEDHVTLDRKTDSIRLKIDQDLGQNRLMDRTSVTETVDADSIPGRVKPKTIKTGIHSFPA